MYVSEGRKLSCAMWWNNTKMFPNTNTNTNIQVVQHGATTQRYASSPHTKLSSLDTLHFLICTILQEGEAERGKKFTYKREVLVY